MKKTKGKNLFGRIIVIIMLLVIVAGLLWGMLFLLDLMRELKTDIADLHFGQAEEQKRYSYGAVLKEGVSEKQYSPVPMTTPIPVTPIPSPELTIAPTPTLVPTPAPRQGDIALHFPEEDTGVDAKYSYQTDSIRIAVREEIRFPEAFYVADVWIRNIESLQCIFSNDKFGSSYQDPREMAWNHNAILAINTEWNAGYVIRNGNTMQMKRNKKPVLIMYEDGTMDVAANTTKKTLDAIDLGRVWNMWSNGPVLVRDGVAVKTLADNSRAPRTVIGYYEPGHYCFIVADGRQQGYAVGMTMKDLGEICEELGCQLAFNMDGGQSSIMLFNSEPINRPYKNGRDLNNLLIIAEGPNLLARQMENRE